MEQLTTKQAFEQVIQDNKLMKKLGINYNTVKTWRLRLQDGHMTIDKMEEIITKAGFSVVQEKLWTNK